MAKARRKRKRRVVELPNSHYTSQQAKDVEARHRWHNIELSNPIVPVVGICWFEAEAYCNWMGKKIVASRDLPEGTVLTEADIAIKSPGDGLQPYRLPEVLEHCSSVTVLRGGLAHPQPR